MIITVYPTKASALNVKHPHGPKMAVGGVFWPRDSFTGRRLSDGSVTEEKAKAYAPDEAAPAVTEAEPTGAAATELKASEPAPAAPAPTVSPAPAPSPAPPAPSPATEKPAAPAVDKPLSASAPVPAGDKSPLAPADRAN